MPRALVLVVSAAVVVALPGARVSAAPCGPTTCAPLSSSVAGSKTLFVRPRGQSGPLVAYDLASGLVTTVSGVQSTRVLSRDTKTGARRASLRIGAWKASVDAVSATGRYAALTWARTDPDVYVVDLVQPHLVRKVHLDGNWTVDGLSRDGRRLYLIEYEQNGYRVRVHDAAQGLLPDPITDPREPEPMTGAPWASIGSPDGRWQLTLY